MHGPTLMHTWSKLTALRRIATAITDEGMNTVKRDGSCWHHTGSWKEVADIDKVNRHCIKVINFHLIFLIIMCCLSLPWSWLWMWGCPNTAFLVQVHLSKKCLPWPLVCDTLVSLTLWQKGEGTVYTQCPWGKLKSSAITNSNFYKFLFAFDTWLQLSVNSWFILHVKSKNITKKNFSWNHF